MVPNFRWGVVCVEIFNRFRHASSVLIVEIHLILSRQFIFVIIAKISFYFIKFYYDIIIFFEN